MGRDRLAVRTAGSEVLMPSSAPICPRGRGTLGDTFLIRTPIETSLREPARKVSPSVPLFRRPFRGIVTSREVSGSLRTPLRAAWRHQQGSFCLSRVRSRGGKGLPKRRRKTR